MSTHVAAGGAGGIAALLVGAPFDTIKVRQQVWKQRALPTLRQCLRQEGLAGLYKGTSPQLVGAVFKGCVRYGAFGRPAARGQGGPGGLGRRGSGRVSHRDVHVARRHTGGPAQDVAAAGVWAPHLAARALARGWAAWWALPRIFCHTCPQHDRKLGGDGQLRGVRTCARSRVRACACVLPSSTRCMQH